MSEVERSGLPTGGSDPDGQPLDTDADAHNPLEPDTIDSNPQVGQRSDSLGQAVRASQRAGALTPDSKPQLTIPPWLEKWNRYEILSLLGVGGMGTVYKARDRRLNRLVALKFIRGDDSALIERFMQEARSQSRIDHPGICKVLEVGEVEDKAYIAMQYVDGESLAQIAPKLSLHEKAQVIHDAALALHAAHQLGIIHRGLRTSSRNAQLFPSSSAPFGKPVSGQRARHEPTQAAACQHSWR